LAALPVPPRSVIIERLPPLPPKPRDIIIERWVPYGAMQKRRTIVQRAAAAQQYAAPRNIIIQYEAVQVRVVRQFQRLGVQPENPQSYVARYGASLFDSATLVQHARAAGVVEDISPPAGAAIGFSAQSYGQESSFGVSSGSGFESGSAAYEGAAIGGIGGSIGGGIGGSSYESSSYESSVGGGYGAGGLGGGAIALGGGGVGGGAIALGGGGSSFESSSSSSYGASGGHGAGAGGFDPVQAAYTAADRNRDGRIDQGEFRQFYQGGL